MRPSRGMGIVSPSKLKRFAEGGVVPRKPGAVPPVKKVNEEEMTPKALEGFKKQREEADRDKMEKNAPTTRSKMREPLFKHGGKVKKVK